MSYNRHRILSLLGTLVGLAAGRTNSALLQCFTASGFI